MADHGFTKWVPEYLDGSTQRPQARPCGLGQRTRRARGIRAGRLSQPPDQARGAVRRRRRERHRRAAMGGAGEGRTSARSMSRTRAALAARSASWRSSARTPDGHTVLLGSASTMVLNEMTLSNPPYDARQGLRADRDLLCDHDIDRGQRIAAGEERQGADRLRQGEHRQAQLWLGRHRHDEPFVGRTVQAAHRSQGPGACALSRRGPGPRRPGQRPHPDHVAEHQQPGPQLPHHRQDPRAVGERAGPPEGRAGLADRHRAGRAGHGRSALPRHLCARGHARRRDRTHRRRHQEGDGRPGVRENPERLGLRSAELLRRRGWARATWPKSTRAGSRSWTRSG